MNRDLTSTSVLPPLSSVSRIFSDTYEFYKTHWRLIGQILVVPLVFYLLLFLKVILPPLVLAIFSLVAGIVLFLARLALFSVAVEGETLATTFKRAYQRGFSRILPFIWLSILLSLAFFGGLVLFFVPGLLLAVWLSVSAFVLFNEDKRGLAALAASWHYVKGYWLAVFWRFIFL